MKRHGLGFLLGLGLAPVIWALTAWSMYRFGSITRHHAISELADVGNRLILPAMLILIAGLAIGFLVGTQLSPLAPGAAGVALIVGGCAFFFAPTDVASLFRFIPGSSDLVFALPAVGGAAFLIGVALCVPLASPGRWKTPTPAEGDGGDELAVAG